MATVEQVLSRQLNYVAFMVNVLGQRLYRLILYEWLVLESNAAQHELIN